MKLDLTINIWAEGNQFVAHALSIDVMSSGPTPQAARDAVDEAMRSFVKTAEDVGTLEQVLDECGYVRQNGVASPAMGGCRASGRGGLAHASNHPSPLA